MAEKQPLLGVAPGLPRYDECDAAAYHDVAQEISRAAAAARLRRRRAVRRAHHFLALLLLVVVGFYTHGFGLADRVSSVLRRVVAGSDGLLIGVGSTPLDGPLELPASPLCLAGSLHVYPTARYPLAFGGEHALVVVQNTTRHVAAPANDAAGADDADPRWRHVHVSGEVVVRQAAAADGKTASVEVEAVSSDARIGSTSVFDADAQRLTVAVDDRVWAERADWHGGAGACLVVRVTVWVPAAARLKTLHVGAVHLGVQLADDLDLVVAESARLSSVVGSIEASRALSSEAALSGAHKGKDCRDAALLFAPGFRFEAPQTDVVTTAGPIRGPWSLLDRLQLFSVSGAVSVAVRPEGTADERPDPARLSIETVSGPIGFEEVRPEAAAAAPRPHRLALVSQSGTVRGSGTFAQLARVHTTSGAVAVALAPQKLPENEGGDTYAPAVLDTTTVSGSTAVELLDEATGRQPVDFVASTHHAVSGAVTLRYPGSWVGDIHLKTVAGGALAVTGKDVHVVPDDAPQWPPRFGRTVDAVKDGAESGGRRSSLRADTVSGSLRVAFPE